MKSMLHRADISMRKMVSEIMKGHQVSEFGKDRKRAISKFLSAERKRLLEKLRREKKLFLEQGGGNAGDHALDEECRAIALALKDALFAFLREEGC